MPQITNRQRHLRIVSMPPADPAWSESPARTVHDLPNMWDAILEDFRAYMRAGGRSAGTIKLRLSYLHRLARAFPGRRPADLQPRELIDFLAGPSWGPETRKSARASLATFYMWASSTGRVPMNPAAELPRVAVPAGAPRPVPSSVLAAAQIRTESDRDRLMLAFAIYAGLRRAEIARVHPDDFTADGLLVHGKGGRRRLVPVHPELERAVSAELELRRAGTHGSGHRYAGQIRPNGYLFPGQSGGPIGPDVVGRTLSRVLGPGWTGHTIRHRFASQAYAADRDLRAVQELLGHSQPETTARYVQTPTGAKRAAVLAVTA